MPGYEPTGIDPGLVEHYAEEMGRGVRTQGLGCAVGGIQDFKSQAQTCFLLPAAPRHQPLQLLAQSEPLGRHVRPCLGNPKLT